MASKPRKPVAKKTKAAMPKGGAAAAVAERSKDTKKTFGKAEPRRVDPAPAARSAKKSAGEKKSVVSGIVDTVKGVASGLFKRSPKPAKAKSK